MRQFEVFDLPYIFASKTALYNVTEGPIGKSLLGKLDAKGITGLAFWDNGFKVMSANKPLHVPADFKGVKMRIQSSRPCRPVSWTAPRTRRRTCTRKKCMRCKST